MRSKIHGIIGLLALILVVAVFVIYIVSSAANESPQVRVDQGLLRGKIGKSERGRAFYTFTGIPYAEPPIGELRFQHPRLKEPWIGMLDATKLHSVCPQPNTFSVGNAIVGDEDCLFLNVYTPELPKPENQLLPVMFFLHGGAWFAGSGRTDMYGPNYFMDKDIVLVTTNFRLGALGFLATGDEFLPGNNGLKDQALAIKWTKTNIERFGGDPSKITIFGQSAGGVSAHFHMFSPMSKNLINGVIAQSGTALNTWALAPTHLAAKRARFLASLCNCDPSQATQEMLKCLKKVDAHEIVKQTAKLWRTDMDPMVIFKPVIEPSYVEDPFLPEDPINMMGCGRFADVPFLTGITTEDGAFRTAILYKQSELLNKLDRNFDEMGPLMLQYDETLLSKYKDDVNDKVRSFYFQDGPINLTTGSVFTKAYTDAVFLLGAHSSVDLHSKYSNKPVYYYLFGYAGSESFCKPDEISENYGVCHGDELLYFFKNDVSYPNYKRTESDRRISEHLINLWTNFARTGNPTPLEDLSNPIKWEPVRGTSKKFYFINRQGQPRMAEGLYGERAQFWKGLSLDYRRIRIRDEL